MGPKSILGGVMVTRTATLTTQVIQCIQRTSQIYALRLEIPTNYPSFHPGQIVHLGLKDSHESPLKPYCLTSLPKDHALEICFDVINGEEGLSSQLKELQSGDSLLISSPQETIALPMILSEEPILLVGLASGIGVCYGLMRYVLQRHPKRMAHVYAINCDDTMIPYEPELEQALDHYAALEVYPVLQTDGFDVNEIAQRIYSHSDSPNLWYVYIAGPETSAQKLKQSLMRQGYQERRILVQGFA
jgi:ferredoxin-NADP reductase